MMADEQVFCRACGTVSEDGYCQTCKGWIPKPKSTEASPAFATEDLGDEYAGFDDYVSRLPDASIQDSERFAADNGNVTGDANSDAASDNTNAPDPVASEGAGRDKIDAAFDALLANMPPGPRTKFVYKPDKHLEIARDVESNLVKRGSRIYTRGELVTRVQDIERPVTDDTTGEVRLVKHLGTKTVNQSMLRYEIEKVSAFFKPKGDKEVFIRPPIDIADTIMQQESWSFKPVVGVMECPSIRGDGSLILKPGYDDQSHIYYHFDARQFSNLKILENGGNLTYGHAIWAAQQLLDLFKQSRFYDYYSGHDERDWHGIKVTRSHSVALSHLMTPVTRPAYRTAPLHAVIAAAANQGKSYVQEVASMLATERELGPISFKPRDDQKNELELDSAMMSSLPIVQWDNVNKITFGGQTYYLSPISQGKKSVRKYHTQDTHEVSCRGTSFFINGINLTFTEEMARRTIAAWLRQRDEGHQWDKSHDPMQLVHQKREFYVMCILTIVRAYHAALATGSADEGLKRAKAARAFDSFHGWDRFVRLPLIWLGLPDPKETSDHLIANAEDRQQEHDLLAEIVAVLGTMNDFTTRRLLGTYCTQGKPTFLENLREACLEVAGVDGQGEVNARKLGNYFAAISDKRIKSLMLVRCKNSDGETVTHSGAAVYRIERIMPDVS